jgi:hypothetical protein
MGKLMLISSIIAGVVGIVLIFATLGITMAF